MDECVTQTYFNLIESETLPYELVSLFAQSYVGSMVYDGHRARENNDATM